MINVFIIPPTLKKLKGHIGLGLSLRLPVCLCVRYALGQESLEIGSCYLVCGRSMKIKTTRILSSPEPKAHKVNV